MLCIICISRLVCAQQNHVRVRMCICIHTEKCMHVDHHAHVQWIIMRMYSGSTVRVEQHDTRYHFRVHTKHCSWQFAEIVKPH